MFRKRGLQRFLCIPSPVSSSVSCCSSRPLRHITFRIEKGCRPLFFLPVSRFQRDLLWDVFQGSFDVADVDIVFEVMLMVPQRHQSQQRKIMTHKQEKKKGNRGKIVDRNLHSRWLGGQ